MKKHILIILILLAAISLNAYSYGQNKVQKSKIDWKVLETKHFDIHYTKQDDLFGQTIAYIAESAYYHLNSYFKMPLQRRVPIIIYQSKQEFQTTNIIYPLLTEGVGGFTESVRNRVVVPFDGSYKKFEEVLIHELTHAYVNDISGSFLRNPLFDNNFSYLPFWFSEGLPEYLSIGGDDAYNNMFVLDLVLNDRLYPINNISGYYAYRLGEAFLVWLGEEYGEDMPTKFFYQLRISSDLDAACQRMFGQKFSDIEKRFHLYLKRKYYPIIENHFMPMEKCERLTNAEDFKASMNYSPRFSPNTGKVVFFSDKMARTGIWEVSPYEQKKKPKKIMQGELDSRFEEFHFQRSNISYFPNGEDIAFVAKTIDGDKIYIYNIKKKKVKSSIQLDQFDAIYEIDVDKTGERIAFSGQANNKNNLYIYDLKDQSLTQITDDHYKDAQPRWSYDGKKIVFTSERSFKENSKYDHVFSKLNSNIFIYDIEDASFYQVTFDDFNNSFPLWRSNNEEILYVSEENGVSNLKAINIINSTMASFDTFYSGVLDADLSSDDDMLVFSCFNGGAWDIYLLNMPFGFLEYQACAPIQSFSPIDDFQDRFNIQDYVLFGKSPEDVKEKKQKDSLWQKPESIEKDSLAFYRMKNIEALAKIDEKPDSTHYSSPLLRDYSPKLKIDSFWGGMAYSSSIGTMGVVQLGLTDLMGNHALGINAEINGDLKDSNFILSYLYLPYRIDYGLAVYKTSDDAIYYNRQLDEYYRLTERQLGAYVLLRYPFSKYFRIDLEQSVYEYQEDWDIYSWDDEDWHDLFIDKTMNASPAISFIYDNALYSSTGPASGIRAFYQVKKNFAKENYDFLTNYADIRFYKSLTERFSLANRFIYGHSSGGFPQGFNLLGFNGVRGNEKEKIGTSKALMSAELRYPFIDYIKLGFPLPIALGDIRGAIFTDIGSVWNKGDSFQGMKNGKLQDLTLGFGFGPRMNIGYFILKLDIAWKSDLINHGKPSYYFSINQEF